MPADAPVTSASREPGAEVAEDSPKLVLRSKSARLRQFAGLENENVRVGLRLAGAPRLAAGAGRQPRRTARAPRRAAQPLDRCAPGAGRPRPGERRDLAGGLRAGAAGGGHKSPRPWSAPAGRPLPRAPGAGFPGGRGSLRKLRRGRPRRLQSDQSDRGRRRGRAVLFEPARGQRPGADARDLWPLQRRSRCALAQDPAAEGGARLLAGRPRPRPAGPAGRSRRRDPPLRQ